MPVEIGVVAFVQPPGEFFIALAGTGTEKNNGSDQDEGEACGEHGKTEGVDQIKIERAPLVQ